MNQPSHKLVTQKAFDILRSLNGNLQLLRSDTIVAQEAYNTDDYADLEFVDVEGGIGSGGRDNPHDDEFWAVDDEAHKTEEGRQLTSYNHFIDIKKGEGRFDDYDGYSYAYGSAHVDQFQDASDAAGSFMEKIAGEVSGMKVDEGINWWFNDEYVHAPGQSWYDKCSPAVERYSFPADKGKYSSVEQEALARFPLANSTGADGRGIPYSVFMPVDNLARYWYDQFNKLKNPIHLGPVMHAIQDASVLQHAAGYSGNWHQRYEEDLEAIIPIWMNEPGFINEIKELFMQWYRYDSCPPIRLAQNDWSKTPAKNWRVDMLVTWVALNSYRDYATVYNHFRGGYSLNIVSARNLVKIATAMSLLVLAQAAGYVLPPPKYAKISCTDDHHNFEAPGEGQWSEYTFTINSTGELPLNIRSITPPTTPQFAIKSISRMIPGSVSPSDFVAITVRFTAPASPTGPNRYNDSITIISDANNQPALKLLLHGRNSRVPEISVSDNYHDFGIPEVGHSKDYTFEITSSGMLPLTIQSISAPATPYYTIANMSGQLPVTLEPSGSMQFTVRFTTPLANFPKRPNTGKLPKPSRPVAMSPIGTKKDYNDVIYISSNADNDPHLKISLHAGLPKGPDLSHIVDMEIESLKSKLNWPVLSHEEIVSISDRVKVLEEIKLKQR